MRRLPGSAFLSKRTVASAVAGVAFLALTGCESKPPPAVASAEPPPPAPVQKQGVYKIGAPYQTGGVWYYPSLDLNYDETGIASLFPPSFREDQTANGERFDENALAAAHKTLPMPSIVQVTNLENGRQIQVRINDRGSYEPGRIIQLTRHAGDLLGIPANSLARVRVKIMSTESIQVASLAGASPVTTGGRVADPLPQASPRGDVVAQQLAPPTGARQSPEAPPASRPPLLAAAEPPPLPPTQAPPPPQMPAQTQMPAAGQAQRTLPPALPASSPPRPGLKPPAPRLVASAPALPETVRTVPVRQTQLYIQAGAFARPDGAERVRERLIRFGRAQIVPARHGRETLYRVRLGPIPNIDDADRMLSRVIASGINEAKIVVD